MLSYEANTHAKKIKNAMQEHTQKLKKTVKLIIGFVAAILFLTLLAITMSSTDITTTVIISAIILLGGYSTLIIIYLLITKTYVSVKITYEVLTPLLVQQYNYDEGTQITHYADNPNIYKRIMNETGLFTRGGWFKRFEECQGMCGDYSFSIIRGQYFISTGNTTTNVFNGNIIKIDGVSKDLMQIRNKSKPYVKGVKFDKYTQHDLLIYIEAGKELPDNINSLSVFTKDFLDKTNSKNVVLATINNALYFAYDGPAILKKIKTIDQDIVIERYKHFKSELSLVEPLIQLVQKNESPDNY